MDLAIREDDLSGEAIRALVALHVSGMHAHSPADKVHALPVEALRSPDVTFYAAWHGDALAGMGAIRHLADDHGELKSMRVASGYVIDGFSQCMALALVR